MPTPEEEKETLALQESLARASNETALQALAKTKGGRDKMWEHVCDLVSALESNATKLELQEMSGGFYSWFDEMHQASL